MRADFVIVAGLALALASCSDSAPEYPLGTPQQMMANEMQPTAETYWNSVRFVSELVDGEIVETEYEPSTDAEWEEVRAAAERLGELGEILQTPAYSEGRGSDWTAYAQGLVDAAAQAEAAAAAQNPDEVFIEGGTVYNVCRACHQMYPPEVLPEGMTVDDLE